MNMAKKTLLYLCAIFFLVLFGFPFIFVLISSFKNTMDYMTNFWGLPAKPYLGNYIKVFTSNFPRYFFNSVVVSLTTVFITVIFGSMASFAFAKLRFKLSGILFLCFLTGMMIPVHTTLIPIFTLTRRMGIYDTIFALMGPYISFALPISVFIITGFFRDVPASLHESATIDGAGPFTIYWRIMLPLSTPAISTVAIYNFLASWNEFIYALTLVSSSNSKTLPLGVREFYGYETINLPAILCAVLIASLPVMLFYFFAQEKVISGLAAGAIKE